MGIPAAPLFIIAQTGAQHFDNSETL